MANKASRIIRHRTFRAIAVVILLWGGFTLTQSFLAPGRLDPALREAIGKQESVGRIAVTLDFVPESFHINYLQQHGAVAGVQDKTIFLVQVPSDEIRQLSQLYWVQSIRLAP
jgi:hypothetical protein